jgi:hypothetical protein
MSVIGEVVHKAQDTLARIGQGNETHRIADMLTQSYSQGQYPQTLGELCLELHDQKWRNAKMLAEPLGMEFDYDYATWDAMALRTALYHRHTDPAQERLHRLKDLVSNAHAPGEDVYDRLLSAVSKAYDNAPR